jgi:uncharacterized membrane protein
MMLVPALHMGRLLRLREWQTGLCVSALMVLWDIALEAAVTHRFPLWVWHSSGGFYGVPAQNWLGWGLTAWLIAAAYLRLTPSPRPDPSRLPIAIYVLQCAFVASLAAVCGRHAGAALFTGVAAGLALGHRLVRTRHREGFGTSHPRWDGGLLPRPDASGGD